MHCCNCIAGKHTIALRAVCSLVTEHLWYADNVVSKDNLFRAGRSVMYDSGTMYTVSQKTDTYDILNSISEF